MSLRKGDTTSLGQPRGGRGRFALAQPIISFGGDWPALAPLGISPSAAVGAKLECRPMHIPMPARLVVSRSRSPGLYLAFLFLSGIGFGGLPSRLLAQGPDLYAAEAPVAGESSEQRSEAMRTAFRRVLVKLTGRRAAATQGQLAPLVEQGIGLVQEYRYRLEPVAGGDPAARPERRLWVRFDAVAVEQLLTQQQLPIWTGRPRVLLWLGLEQKRRRELSNLEDGVAEQSALMRSAEARGVAVQLPLLDLEDQTRLSPADLWQNNLDGIRAASQRYGATTILNGRLTRTGRDRWQASWTLVDREARQDFASAPGSLADVLGDGIDQSVDRLVEQSVPFGSDDAADRYRLRFVGVQTLSDYAELLTLVGRQASVSRLAMRHADGDMLAIDVWLRGDVGRLDDGLRADGRLSRALGYQPPPTYDQEGNPMAVEADADVVYRWSP